MRLIDADALFQMIKGRCHDCRANIEGCLECFEDEIAEAPTIDYEPVRHGSWCGTLCSACGCSCNFDFDWGYCPYCGAKMDLMNEGTTTQEANVYEVWWRAYGDNRHAYVKAENEERAKEIAQELLTRETKITEIFRVDESRITPQSITLNFANTSEYELFG